MIDPKIPMPLIFVLYLVSLCLLHPTLIAVERLSRWMAEMKRKRHPLASRFRKERNANPIPFPAGTMFTETHSTDVVIHALSIRLAKQCRSIVQGCLLEEERRLYERECYNVIRAGLEGFAKSKHGHEHEDWGGR